MRTILVLVMACAALVFASTASADPADHMLASVEFIAEADVPGPNIVLARARSNNPNAVLEIKGNANAIAQLGRVMRASAIACATVGWTRIHRDWFGFVIFKYTQYVSWCWDGRQITNQPNRWSQPSQVDHFWRYDGQIAATGSFFLWNGSYRGGHWGLRQGMFSYTLPVVGGGSTKYPWVKIWNYGNGGWSATSGMS